jgi:two-component system nitrate/nitrite response regulator NarL
MSCVRVVIGDRHPVVLRGLKAILCPERGFNVVASYCDGTECLNAIRDLSPDIALLDVLVPGHTGLEILVAVKSECLCTRVVFFSAMEDRQLAAAAAWGAYGVITKEATPELLVDFLSMIAVGRLLPLALLNADAKHEQERCARLTERERQIVELVSEGLSSKEVGRRLDLAEGTIRVHLHNIYQKLGISNRTALAASTTLWKFLHGFRAGDGLRAYIGG